MELTKFTPSRALGNSSKVPALVGRCRCRLGLRLSGSIIRQSHDIAFCGAGWGWASGTTEYFVGDIWFDWDDIFLVDSFDVSSFLCLAWWKIGCGWSVGSIQSFFLFILLKPLMLCDVMYQGWGGRSDWCDGSGDVYRSLVTCSSWAFVWVCFVHRDIYIFIFGISSPTQHGVWAIYVDSFVESGMGKLQTSMGSRLYRLGTWYSLWNSHYLIDRYA